MSSNAMRALAGAVVVVIAVVLLIVLQGNSGSDTKTDGGKLQTIVVDKAGHPVGGIKQLTYNKGERIRFKVEVPFAEEVHLHGYDVMKDVPDGGGSVTYDLPASIEGVFEAELEGRKEQIIELTVNP
jgi:low affinity Fe/Cu permease